MELKLQPIGNCQHASLGAGLIGRNTPLNPPVPETFYASGPGGYTDYPALPD